MNQTLALTFKTLLFFTVFCILHTTASATPFPVKGPIFDGENKPVGTAHVYPKFVEIFDPEEKMIGKVGVMIHQGIAKLFLVGADEESTLVGYGSGGKIFDWQDRQVGSYFWTPTYSFAYDLKGKRAGKVKCIAWPRVCAIGVAGFLLHLYEGKKNEDTQKTGGGGDLLPR